MVNQPIPCYVEINLIKRVNLREISMSEAVMNSLILDVDVFSLAMACNYETDFWCQRFYTAWISNYHVSNLKSRVRQVGSNLQFEDFLLAIQLISALGPLTIIGLG